VEALIRWQHPVRGLLFPDAFLPAIKEHPSSQHQAGGWVCSAVAQWRSGRQKLDISVSVNIDDAFSTSSFVARLTDIYWHSADGPGQLDLEVLETSALEDMEHVR
jgi:EAL domain-containing protein (putative c-di-GMP-specific phosphodiesterase class I)